MYLSIIFQIIVSSDEWSESIKDFVEVFLIRPDYIGPYIIIGHPLEVLVYSQMKLQAHPVMKNSLKLKTMKQLILKHQDSTSAKVIFVASGDKAMKLQSYLKRDLNIESFVLHFKLSQYEAQAIYENFANNPGTLLIVSDNSAFQKSLTLKHEDLIIHYDYPESKFNFANRFLHMKNLVQNIYAENSKKPIENCHLILGPKDVDKFKTIKNLLSRTRSNLPENLNKMYQMAEQDKFQRAKHENLCDIVKLKGCCDEMRCKKRHFLNKTEDNFLNLNSDTGVIEFSVIKVLSANHFKVKVLQIKNDGNKSVFKQEQVVIKLFKLNRMDEEKFERKNELDIGQFVCVHDHTDQNWKRGLVRSIDEQVHIELIDEAILKKFKKEEIFNLPEEFDPKILPKLIHEVVILNLKPRDKSSKWPKEANELVRRTLNAHQTTVQSERMCRSRFYLCSNGIFWVSKVQGIEKIHDENISWTPIFEIKEMLEIFSEKNFEHCQNLLKLCQKSNLSTDLFKSLSQIALGDPEQNISLTLPPQKIDLPKYFDFRGAFFDQNELNISVQIVEIYDPFDFYVQLVKFQPQLKNLENDLATEAEEFFQKRLEFEPEIGQICIGQYGGCAQICRVKYLDENFVNFLDYGSQWDLNGGNLAPISKKNLEKLPFQAIHCKLSKIQPINGEEYFSEEAIEHFQKEYVNKFLWVNNPKKISEGFYEVELTIPESNEIVSSKFALDGYGEHEGEILNLENFRIGQEDFLGIQNYNVSDFDPEEVLKELNNFGQISEQLKFDANSNARDETKFQQIHTNPDPSDHDFVPKNHDFDRKNPGRKSMSKSDYSNDSRFDPVDPELDQIDCPYSINKQTLLDDSESDQKLASMNHEVSLINQEINPIDPIDPEIDPVEPGLDPIDPEFNSIGPRIPIYNPDIPEDMPSLAFSQDQNPETKLPDSVTWSQNSRMIILNFNFNKIVKILPSRLNIKVNSKSFDLSYLDISYENSVEIVKLFQIPSLTFFSEVIPNETKINFTPNDLKVHLTKNKAIFWPKICIDPESLQPIKIPWLKHEALEDHSESDNENVEDSNQDLNPNPRKFFYGVRDVESSDEKNFSKSEEDSSSDSSSY